MNPPLPKEALVAARPRRVLLFTGLPKATYQRLEQAGCSLIQAETVLGAVALLADRDFDAAVLDMEMSEELVKRLKAGRGEIEEVPDALAEQARARSRSTPFFLRFGDGLRFVVVVDVPDYTYVEPGDALPLGEAVLQLDVGKLKIPGAPSA
ncbi:MAG: hypothetical protein IPJ65_16995 [Archangiaceae bacterium]|nr:hypothetical protein [Archangiaceae bacterium]